MSSLAYRSADCARPAAVVKRALQQPERRDRKSNHVGVPVRRPGFERMSALSRAADGDAGMPGGVAVAVAGRTRGARFRQAPGGAEPLPRHAGEKHGIGFRGGAHAGHHLRDDPEQGLAGRRGIDDRSAEEVARRPGNGEERRRDESAGRRFRDGDRLAALDQARGNPCCDRFELGHALPPITRTRLAPQPRRRAAAGRRSRGSRPRRA
jgi:hypothetical protein